MFRLRHRHVIVPFAVLCALAGIAHEAGARTVNVTALPLPDPACPGVANAIPGDNSTDQPAFDCAVDLLPQEGGTIYVPAGTFDLTAPIAVIDKHVAIRGEGQQITRLRWNSAGDGISFVSTTSQTYNYTLAVRSLSLLKSGTDGGAAIHGVWPRTSWHGERGIVTTVIHDVHIGSTPWPSDAYWHFGIQLQNSTTAKISMFNIQGKSASSGIAAIQIHGDNAADGKSIGTQIRDGAIMKYVRGIEAKEHAEGLHVQEVSMHEVGYGVQLSSALGTAIANNYIQARVVGIDVWASSDIAVTNNLIHQFSDETFRGISVAHAGSIRVIGNGVHSTGAAQALHTGIVLDGNTTHALVEGNTTSNMTVGLWVPHTGVIFSVLIGNINRNWVSAPIADWSSPGANKFDHNH